MMSTAVTRRWRAKRFFGGALPVVALLFGAANGWAATERISQKSDGTQGDVSSWDPQISADGRYVVFEFSGTTLVPGAVSGTTQLYLKDRSSGTIEIVSVNNAGEVANGTAYYPVMSADGNYVVFLSGATNLVASDLNPGQDIFLRNLITHQTELVSRDSSNSQIVSAGLHQDFAVSGDGRYVVFANYDTSVSPKRQLYLRDRTGSSTVRISSAPGGGAEGDNDSQRPAISADGRYVVFESYANNLVAGGTTGAVSAIYSYDRATQETTLISRSLAGGKPGGGSSKPQLSADGRYVVYESSASNIVANDTNGVSDIFVFDRQTGTTTRASIGSDGAQSDGDASGAVISGNGRYIAFRASATTLDPASNNPLIPNDGYADVYVRDTVNGATNGTTRRLSVDANGIEGNDSSDKPIINHDGSVIAFESHATNLIAGDTNGVRDIYAVTQQSAGIKLSLKPVAIAATYAAGDPVLINVVLENPDDATLGGGFDITIDSNALGFTSFAATAPELESQYVDTTPANNGMTLEGFAFGSFSGISATEKVIGTLTFSSTGLCSATQGTPCTDTVNVSISQNNLPYGGFYSAQTFQPQAVTFTGTTITLTSGEVTPPPGYVATAVEFDGTNDWLFRGTELTGNADSKTGLLSFWIKPGAVSGAQYIYTNADRFYVQKTASNQIRVRAVSATNQTVFDQASSALTANTWSHVLIAWNTATGYLRFYINDVLSPNGATVINSAVDTTLGQAFVGAYWDGTARLNACLADFYLTFAETLDIDSAGNRRKFIDAAGKPVNPGVNGATPTGTSPLIFLSGNNTNFAANNGTGGGFSVSGALSNCADAPGSASTGADEITIEQAAIPGNNVVNLTTEGTADWVRWGRAAAVNVDRKAGVTAQISDITLLGGATRALFGGNASYWSTHSWSDGSPTATTNGSASGLYFPGAGKGVQLTVPADTTVRTLKLYLGAWQARGKLEASLYNSNTALPIYTAQPIYIDDTADPVETRLVTINYRAATAGHLTVTYTLDTDHGGGNVALQAVTLTTSANQPPVAANDTYSVNEDNALSGNVLTNDSDPDSGPSALTVQSNTLPATGTLTGGLVNANGSFSYTPNANFNGTDSFTYTVSDSVATAATTVTITVNPVNDAPVFTSTPVTTGIENSSYSYDVNATDAEGHTLTYGLTVFPTGMSINTATGLITWTPSDTQAGNHNVTVVVTDNGIPALSATQSFTITVANVNQAPTPVLDTVSGNEDTTITVPVATLLANDSDPDGDAVIFDSVTNNAGHGTVAFNAGANSVNYTPNTNYHGADSFTYTVKDPGGLTANATVNVTVSPVNDAPVAEPGTLSVTSGATATGQLIATDIDGDSLTYSLVTTGTKGSATLTNTATGAYSYTALVGASGTDTFTFKANDNTVDSNIATVTVTINAATSGGDLNGVAENLPGTAIHLSGGAPGDWMHWGMSTATDVNRKAGVSPQINLTSLTAEPYRFADARASYSWSGGTPTATSAGTATGIFVTTIGNGFELTVPADTAQRILTLYLGGWKAQGRLEASLSDGSAVPYVVTLNNATAAFDRRITINFRAAGPGKVLTVRYVLENDYGDVWGNLSISGATLRTIAPLGSGNLAGQSAAVPANNVVDLTTEDTADWIRWGRATATDVDRKAGVTAQISDLALLGGATRNRFGANATYWTTHTWSDGTPTATTSGTSSGLYFPGIGKGIELTVPADTTPRTLTLYLGAWQAKGNLEVTLSDNSAQAYVLSIDNPTSTVDTRIVTITFNAASANRALTVTYTLDNDYAGGNIAIQAATLTDAGGTGAYQQDAGTDGLIAIDAEHFDINTAQGSHTWTAVTVPAGYAGAGAMQATPNTGTNNTSGTGYITVSPRLDYAVNFVQTGTYYVWIRGHVQTSVDDSLHLGLDGTAITSAADLTFHLDTPDAQGWVWTRKRIDGAIATLNVTTPGVHTLNIWMREDGAVIDKLVLTTNSAWLPSGSGPAESSRGNSGGSSNVTPTPFNDSYTINEDNALSGNVLTNDSDPDNGPSALTVQSNTLPANGTLTGGLVNANGSFTYTPNANFSGSDSFTYTISDSAAPATATVNVTVNPVNDAPVITSTPVTTGAEGISYTYDVNASDIDSATLTYSLTVAPVGMTINTTTGVISWTPTFTQAGNHNVTVTVTDNGTPALTASQSFVIAVANTNRAPQPAADTLSGNEDTTITVPVTTLLANDSDPDGDTVNFVSATNGANGTVSVSAGTVSYTPAANFNGAASFTYTVSDGSLTASATVNVTVSPVNDAPQASNGTLSVTSGASATGTLTATDLEGDTLTYSLVTTGTKGTATLTNTATGAYSYTALVGATGTDTFTFKVYDGTVDSNIATVTVTINAATSAFQQGSGPDGFVSIEAEHFDTNVASGTHTWNLVTPVGYSGAGAMQATPNTGTNNDTGYVTTSPRLDFNINFVKTGLHYVWVRGQGASGTDDSLHVGLDGIETASSDRMTYLTTPAWTWTHDKTNAAIATINITTPGLHTLNVWMREDGTVVDKLVLTTNAAYVPTDIGPVENTRTPGGNNTPTAHAGGPYTATVNNAVTFNGSGSIDPDGNALTYAWNFGDSTTGTGTNPSHTYSTAGTYTVTLTVNDGAANSAPMTSTVSVAAASTNLLINPDFETGSKNPWLGSGGIVGAADAHSGNWAYSIGGNATQYLSLSQRVTVTAGATYEYSGWMKIVGRTTGSYMFEVRWYNAAGSEVQPRTVVGSLSANAAYTYFSKQVVAPAGATQGQLRFQANQADGAGYFDDTRIITVP